MSTPPEQNASQDDVDPAVDTAPEVEPVEEPAAVAAKEPVEPAEAPASDDAKEPVDAPAADAAPARRPAVRDLTRWGIPFHFLPAVVVAVTGIVMLLVGGTVGWFGGWWLAAALPIAIGAFLRAPWFAALPLALWGGWLVYVGGAAEDATLSRTPTLLGICLGLIGTGATLVAQRAIFPATAPGAWEASVGRIVPPLDDGEAPELDEDPADETIDLIAEPIEATEEELEAASAAAVEEATIAEIARLEADPQDAPEGEAGESDDASEASAAGGSDATDDDASEADAGREPVSADGSDASTDEDADPSDAAADDADTAADSDDADAVPPTPVVEVPLDADTAELDEGGHVTEFAALSEVDLAGAADSAGPDSAAGAEATTGKGTAEAEADADAEADAEAEAEDETEQDAGAEPEVVTAGAGADAPAPKATASKRGRKKGKRR